MPNDLTPNNLPAKQITPVLTPELRSQLDADTSDTWAITNSPALREEAKAVLPVLKAAAFQPAGEEGVRDVIGRRFAIFPQPVRSDGEWAAWWSDYYETLEGVGWAALEAGMNAWVADPSSEFMPKPGKLLALSRTTPNRAARHYTRAKRAVEQQPDPADDFRALGEGYGEAVRKLLDDFNREFASKRQPLEKPSYVFSTPETDGSGLTPEMRQRMRGED